MLSRRLVSQELGFAALCGRGQFQVRWPDVLVVSTRHLEVVDLLRYVVRLRRKILLGWRF